MMEPTARKPSVSSLYLANLHPDVSELLLYDKFLPIGPILSIRVCRDPVTRRSYGYAYVNLQCAVDAQRAVDTMNYDIICGQPVRIMFSVHDPSLYKSGVFIKNLDSSVDGKSLQQIFSTFGSILSARVLEAENGSGFVHFESQEAAEKAICKMNGAFINERKLSVVRFKSRRTRQVEFSARVRAEFTNIYIKNLGEEVDDGHLKKLFDSFGHMVSLKVMTDENGNTKGFGFINYERHEDAQRAVEEMNGKDMNGKIIYVGRAQKKVERQLELKRQFEQMKQDRISKCQSANLYVKNLDKSIDDERLQKEFSKFGTITSAKVMMEGEHSKGFGFVCFSSPQEASKARTEMNGKFLATKPLYVSLAQSKKERQAYLTDQYMKRFACRRGPPNSGSSSQLSLLSTKQIAQVRPSSPCKLQNDRFHPLNIMPGAFQPAPRLPTFNTIRSSQGVTSAQTMRLQPTGFTALTATSTSHSTLQYKYSAAARNLQQHLNDPPCIATQQAAVPVQGQESLTATTLSSASPEEQKEMLGEQLFLLVQTLQPTMTSKITGMLLELDNSELLHLLESPESLRSMVDEAVEVLRAHQTKETSL